ncbi:MAG: response regulator transcription factor [Sporolactobacillus sp.]
MSSILVVDDDPNIRELINVFMENEGFSCIDAENGAQALEKLDSGQIGLVILDIMMPEMDGWTFCKIARENNPQLPILMLTAKGETMQKVKGFKLGADDYLVKPFEPIELVMRVKALMKRYQVSASQTVHVGNITIDRKTHEIHERARSYTIPMKEFELLFMLAAFPGRTYARDDLIEHIWGYDYEGDERTVDVHIKRIRERFEETSCGFVIKTVRGLGYRLEEIK